MINILFGDGHVDTVNPLDYGPGTGTNLATYWNVLQ